MLIGIKGIHQVELREKGVSITLIIRADMLVCHAPDERPRLGFHTHDVTTCAIQYSIKLLQTLYIDTFREIEIGSME